MSSRGELFITEDVRNEFENDLDRMFGKDCWSLAVGDFANLWDERLFPDTMEIDVVDELSNKIGTLKVSVYFSVEGDELNGRYIEAEPFKLLSLEKTK